jgi:hypothetical protein
MPKIPINRVIRSPEVPFPKMAVPSLGFISGFVHTKFTADGADDVIL